MSVNLLIGAGAALAAALIGAGWQLTSRHGVTTSMSPWDVSVLRYAVPGLLLSPLWFKLGWKPAGIDWRHVALLVAGGGLPFGLLVFAGAQHAPAVHIGVFMAGTMPIFTAALCRGFLGESITPVRQVGLALVAAGILLLFSDSWASGTLAAGAWLGDLLFMSAAFLWACNTVAFRLSGLTPWGAAALINGWSAVAIVLLLPWFGATQLLGAPRQELLLQAGYQGLVAGVLGLVTYMAAVTRLGPARASLSAALVPLLTALGGVLLLGEPLGLPAVGAVLLVGLGIVLASRR